MKSNMKQQSIHTEPTVSYTAYCLQIYSQCWYWTGHNTIHLDLQVCKHKKHTLKNDSDSISMYVYRQINMQVVIHTCQTIGSNFAGKLTNSRPAVPPLLSWPLSLWSHFCESQAHIALCLLLRPSSAISFSQHVRPCHNIPFSLRVLSGWCISLACIWRPVFICGNNDTLCYVPVCLGNWVWLKIEVLHFQSGL